LDSKDFPTAEQLNALIKSLFEECTPGLLECARSSGCSPEVAEDLVQDTFAVALEKPLKLYYAPNRRRWLKRTLKNLIWNHQTKVMYAQKLLSMLAQQRRESQTDELNPSVLYRGMIEEKDLRLLFRYWVRQEPVKKIAADLDIGMEACWKRLQRAKARFEKAYKEQMGRLD